MIRPAAPDDLALVQELWDAFLGEQPDFPWREDEEQDRAGLESAVRNGVTLFAEDEQGVAGIVAASPRGTRMAFVDLLYVRERARRQGVAGELMRELVARLRERGVEAVELQVFAHNDVARALYERWGMRPLDVTLGAPLDELERRLAPADGPTFGAIHVQTDDVGAVERAVAKALPRLGRSAGTAVTGPRNGWVAVDDELCNREPETMQRLAKELSYALAAVTLALGVEQGAVVRYCLYDRGGMVDEYLSVPEFYGELPPGDVVALGSNPTVVARLTGAEARRVREVARTASSPADLPPAEQLLRDIADVIGIELAE
ncbi:MAG TPA: GNAT family N-acetyltransferase [Gaiellaceae bacterium]|nr:GNAT family N-acetyltransferase [Gaiellaceae bacterium]